MDAALIRLSLIALVLSAGLAGADTAWRPLPLEGATVTAAAYKGRPEALVAINRLAHGHFAPLAGAEVAVEFAAPLPPGRLGIMRVGWESWALPARIELRADGGAPVEVALGGPRAKPGERPPEAGLDGWSFDRPLRRLELKVLAVEGANGAGSLALCRLVPAPATCPVAGLGGESAGVRLRLASEAPPAMVEAAAVGYRFRRDVRMTLRRPWPVDGVLALRWEEFQADPAEYGQLPLAAIDRIEVNDPLHRAVLTLAGAEALPGGRPEAPAWERLAPLDRRADGEGWRLGVPVDGFGRFGFNGANGLLTGLINDWRLTLETTDRRGRREGLPLDLRPGAAGGVFHLLRRQVDWTGSDVIGIMRPASAVGDLKINHEYGANDPRLRPATITAAITAPGVLVTSTEESFALLRCDGSTAAARAFACTAPGRAEWLAPGATALAEGWLAVVWADRPGIPVLVAPRHRPTAITPVSGGIELAFGRALDCLAVGQPGGWRPAAAGEDAPAALAPACRRLAAQLRAYPRSATQRFRERVGGVEIEERFRHIVWDNDWDEPAEVVAPVPPLAAFAADQGYPIAWTAGDPESLGGDTKYGPWRGRPGAVVRWTLPVGDHRQQLHLRPLGDPLAAVLAKRLPRLPPSQGKDSLTGFWMFASASLALPLFDDAGRATFLAQWRGYLDRSLAPGMWFLRREPWSGASYPVSFGWREHSSNTIGDINSGIGGSLVAAAQFARSSGDWAWAARHWPALDGSLRYFLYQHDWTQMQAGARESTGSSAIDMDAISYAGAAGYVALAEGLGKADEAALGRLLLARLGLSLGFRWAGMRWVSPEVEPEKWPAITHGLHEKPGFDRIGLDWNPDQVHSEMALGLAWMGNFEPTYRQHLAALGSGFWRWYEYDLVGRRLPDWTVQHPGGRHNHPANMSANLYMRALLGAPAGDLRGLLAKQKWGLDPSPYVAAENAGFYALLLGLEAPLTVRSWGCAAPLAADWDAAAGRATLRFAAASQQRVVLALRRAPTALRVAGLAQALPAAGDCTLSVPAGEGVAVELEFAPVR